MARGGGILRQRRGVDVRAQSGSSAPPAASAALPIPRSIAEVDNGKILGFGEDLGEDHPGFLDEEYKRRRMAIVGVARTHEIGQPIPRIAYTPREIETWGIALRRLQELYPTHACTQFLENFPKFGFREDEVPQLEDLHQLLKGLTDWNIRPVAGLLHPRDFLAGLAFRTFHSTQYMRHHSKPMYTPEPDVVHELLGHVPMLADPSFCDLVQTIGAASLGADEKQIWHLTKIYWYTVEFGVIREGAQVKAFGAGVLSSFGELAHMRDGQPSLRPFDPFAPQPKMSYKDGFQKAYVVLESFEEAAQLLRDYCASIAKPGLVDFELPRGPK